VQTYKGSRCAAVAPLEQSSLPVRRLTRQRLDHFG
jgi:hypothetical protein